MRFSLHLAHRRNPRVEELLLVVRKVRNDKHAPGSMLSALKNIRLKVLTEKWYRSLPQFIYVWSPKRVSNLVFSVTAAQKIKIWICGCAWMT